MGFDSGKLVKPLDFDMTKHGGPKGRVPEPSVPKMNRFQSRMQKEVRTELVKLGIELDSTISSPQQILEVLSAIDEDQLQQAQDTVTDIFAELCDGTPTKEELDNIPYRVRNAFFGWLSEELSPEASSVATSLRQLRVVPGA